MQEGSHATKGIRGRVTARAPCESPRRHNCYHRPPPRPLRASPDLDCQAVTVTGTPQYTSFLAMDPNGQHAPVTPSSSRKRSRENETPSQRHKREKAAERQRRKRERDRQAGLQNILAISQQQVQQIPPPPVEVQPPPTQPPPVQAVQEYKSGEELSPEEIQKRDRIRAAARERQRKHRALVKARKLRELGLDMGNDIMPGMDEVQYRINAQGEYQQVLPHELPPHPHPQAHPMHEPPFPQGQPLGGQTFASTLLLSFSCAPLLKQHLLRTLSMTNEELASLEPIIAQAWDHWDQQVCTLLPSSYPSADFASASFLSLQSIHIPFVSPRTPSPSFPLPTYCVSMLPRLSCIPSA